MATIHKIVNNSCQTGLTQKGQWAKFARWPFLRRHFNPHFGDSGTNTLPLKKYALDHFICNFLYRIQHYHDLNHLKDYSTDTYF